MVGSHLINVLKRLTRKKNHTSAQFLSLDYYKEVTLSLVSSPSAESIVFRNEQDIITKNVLKETLSSFEHEVMLYYLNDYSVSEILKRTNRSLKSIDNALTRSKVKLRKRLLNQGAFN
ncbi:RNA polymerase sigma-H factor [compost metagenome]